MGLSFGQGEPLVHAAEQVSSADAEQSGTEEALFWALPLGRSTLVFHGPLQDQAIADLPEDAQASSNVSDSYYEAARSNAAHKVRVFQHQCGTSIALASL